MYAAGIITRYLGRGYSPVLCTSIFPTIFYTRTLEISVSLLSISFSIRQIPASELSNLAPGLILTFQSIVLYNGCHSGQPQ